MVQFVVDNRTGYLLFPLLVLTTLFNPLQGFYDAIIYARPRYMQYRAREAAIRRNMAINEYPSRIESIVHVITSNEENEEDIDGEIMPQNDERRLSRGLTVDEIVETSRDAAGTGGPKSHTASTAPHDEIGRYNDERYSIKEPEQSLSS